MKISVVIPVYGCPNALYDLHSRLKKVLNSITKSYEIILVNDGCPKGSWDKIRKICKDDKKVIGINFTRNFGQHHAINAGMNNASGDYIVLMDCDLQEKPEDIVPLYEKITKGYDIVFTKRKDRKDTRITLLLSKLFYFVFNYFTNYSYDGDIGNLSIAKKEVVDKYNSIKDYNKVYTTYLNWMGYKTATIEVESNDRYDGKSSYTFGKKMDLAIDTITSLSNKPLKLLLSLGTVFAIVGFVYLLVQIIIYFVTKDTNEGWTSIIASIFLMGGLILICLGGVGIYVGNIFNQTNGKPEYFIDETINKRE